MSVARRGFLRLMAAAPVAAPVVAREAAQKAGISALGYGMPMPPSGAGNSIAGGNDWIRDWAKDVFSAGWKEARWQDIKSNPVGALDPDLASSKSLSLSAAVRIQRERNFARMVENERRSVSKRFKEAFGFDFTPEPRP
jgi:hypothetical protein